MLGFLALYHSSGAPVDGEDLLRLAAPLDHRGAVPGLHWGVEGWTDGPVGLVQVQGRPLHDPARGITVVADARIGNRDRVGTRLGWSKREIQAASDSQFILEAYVRWGLDAPKHLVGDFAYALWDARERCLVCARDHIGGRPLFYASGPFGLLCASEVKALLAHPAVDRTPNEGRVAQYLSQQPGDPEATFYRDVRRVQPGHWLVRQDDEVRVRRYWSIEDAPALGQNGESDEELIEQFGETFREAVRCRMESEHRTGVMLSGGLDSSSVAAVAREERRPGTSLPTFSATFPGVSEAEREQIDEERYVRLLADLPGMDAHLVPVTEANPLDHASFGVGEASASRTRRSAAELHSVSIHK